MRPCYIVGLGKSAGFLAQALTLSFFSAATGTNALLNASPVSEAAGAVVMATGTPTHFPGEGVARSFLDYCLIDRRMANGRVVETIEVELDLAMGKHRAIRLDICNEGHSCYVLKSHSATILPAGAAHRLRQSTGTCGGAIGDVGTEFFCKNTLSCAEVELARLFPWRLHASV